MNCISSCPAAECSQKRKKHKHPPGVFDVKPSSSFNGPLRAAGNEDHAAFLQDCLADLESQVMRLLSEHEKKLQQRLSPLCPHCQNLLAAGTCSPNGPAKEAIIAPWGNLPDVNKHRQDEHPGIDHEVPLVPTRMGKSAEAFDDTCDVAIESLSLRERFTTFLAHSESPSLAPSRNPTRTLSLGPTKEQKAAVFVPEWPSEKHYSRRSDSRGLMNSTSSSHSPSASTNRSPTKDVLTVWKAEDGILVSNGDSFTFISLRQIFDCWRTLQKKKKLAFASEADDLTRGGRSITKESADSEHTVAGMAITLLPFWRDIGAGTANWARSRSYVKYGSVQRFQSRFVNIQQEEAAASKWRTNPLSSHRMSWEIVGVTLITYDLVMIPLMAFGPKWEKVTEPMLWITAIYWTLDMLFSCSVGFHSNGALETRLWSVVGNYLKTWFMLDLIVISCDWSLLILDLSGLGESDASEKMGYLKVGRWLRILRFVRLVRLAKLHFFFDRLLEDIISDYLVTILRVTKLILFILVSCHLIACAWYGLGYHVSHSRTTWVADAFTKQDDFDYRYFTSLHWSVTQFTPASMEVVPTNALERAFNCFVVIFAMVMFSSFVSSITEAMTYLRKVNAKKSEQYEMLRQYMTDNGVSVQLARRIWQYLDQSVRIRQQRKLWHDIELFTSLPENLQSEVHFESYMPTVTRHPFFYIYNEACPAALRSMCHKVINEIATPSGQYVFNQGEHADHMYFVIQGHLDYFVSASTEMTDSWEGAISSGEWASEAAIWVTWLHVGRLVSSCNSVLLALSGPSMHAVMKQYLKTLAPCYLYAKDFCQRAHLDGKKLD